MSFILNNMNQAKKHGIVYFDGEIVFAVREAAKKVLVLVVQPLRGELGPDHLGKSNFFFLHFFLFVAAEKKFLMTTNRQPNR